MNMYVCKCIHNILYPIGFFKIYFLTVSLRGATVHRSFPPCNYVKNPCLLCNAV